MKKKIALLLVAPLLISCGSQEISTSTTTTTTEQSTSAEHVHHFSNEWTGDADGHYHVCECGAHDEIQAHTFGDWKEVIPPTKTTEGLAERICSVCDYAETKVLDKYPYYRISIYQDDELLEVVDTDTDGNYVLDVPEDKEGSYFAGYYDKDNNLFDVKGTVNDDVSITLKTTVTPFEVSSEELLDLALTTYPRTFILTGDFEITKSHYVMHNVNVQLEKNIELTRATSFGGDVFVLGLDKDDNVVEDIQMNVDTLEHTLIINGNSGEINADPENPTVLVKGSSFFISNLAKLSLNGSVELINNKKVDNDLALLFNRKNETDTDEYEEGKFPLVHQSFRAGGSAIMLIDGTLNLKGVTFDHCSSNNKGATSDELSSKGGAIFSYGTLNVVDATFTNNEGSYGSAFYSGRVSNVSKALFKNNYSYDYGTVYVNDSQYSVTTMTAEELGDIVFEENTSAASGAAVFVSGKGIFVGKKVSFATNTSNANGGAIASKGIVDLSECEFKNNSGTGSSSKGGAIYSYYDDSEDKEEARLLKVDKCLFEANSANNGGAVGFGTSIDTVTVDTVHGPLGEISNTTFKSNTCGSNGAALYFAGKADVSLNKCTGQSNSATNYGGFIYMTGVSNVVLREVTSTSNSAKTGGFVYITTTGTVIKIYSGSSKGCSATTANTENIYSNTNKTFVYIKGTDTKEYFDYDGALFSSKNTQSILDLDD